MASSLAGGGPLVGPSLFSEDSMTRKTRTVLTVIFVALFLMTASISFVMSAAWVYGYEFLRTTGMAPWEFAAAQAVLMATVATTSVLLSGPKRD